MSEPTVRVRIELRHIRPKIWRRIEIPVSTTLSMLHEIIQVSFDWWNYHLWEFQIRNETYGILDFFDEVDWKEIHDAEKFRLQTFIDHGVKRFGYLYDFGDHWEHDVIFGAVRESKIDYPVLVGGAGCRPPEDVGGIRGFMKFLEAMNDASHEEHEEYVVWYGKVFDPDEFDKIKVNWHLKNLSFP